MKKARYKRKRINKTLGEVTSELAQNSVQPLILIILVFVIVFFLVANIPKLFDRVLGITKPNGDASNDNNNDNGRSNSLTNNIIDRFNKADLNLLPNNAVQEPTLPSQVHTLQWLLQKAGYNVGSTGVDGIYGNNTRQALSSFARDNGLSFTNNEGFFYWITKIRNKLRNANLIR